MCWVDCCGLCAVLAHGQVVSDAVRGVHAVERSGR